MKIKYFNVQMLKCYHEAAFTLIEMIVVIAIIGLISGLVLARYRTGGQVYDLKTYTEKMVGVLKQAQSLALAGQETEGGQRVGYGVYIFNEHTYYLFADISGDNQWDINDTTLQSFTLPERFVVASASGGRSFLFTPPFGAFYLNGDRSTVTTSFTITHAVLNRAMIIFINGLSGLIDYSYQ